MWFIATIGGAPCRQYGMAIRKPNQNRRILPDSEPYLLKFGYMSQPDSDHLSAMGATTWFMKRQRVRRAKLIGGLKSKAIGKIIFQSCQSLHPNIRMEYQSDVHKTTKQIYWSSAGLASPKGRAASLVFIFFDGLWWFSYWTTTGWSKNKIMNYQKPLECGSECGCFFHLRLSELDYLKLRCRSLARIWEFWPVTWPPKVDQFTISKHKDQHVREDVVDHF